MYLAIRLRRSVCYVTAALLLVALGGAAVFRALTVSSTSTKKPPENSVTVPIIMYHSILQSPKRLGKFVLSPTQLEEDLRYLKEHGYTTVVMRDLIDYVQKGTPLPEKPVILSFDDGYYNNYLYAYPLLKQYACKMVLSPIGCMSEHYSQTEERHANYSHVTWNDLKEMMASGLVEVQNHTYDMHQFKGKRKGCMRVSGETLDTYQKALTDDVTKAQNLIRQNTGYTPTTFVYPFGAVSKDAPTLIRGMGFQATLGCEGRLNYITRDPECLYNLGRFLRPTGQNAADYFEKTVHLNG